MLEFVLIGLLRLLPLNTKFKCYVCRPVPIDQTDRWKDKTGKCLDVKWSIKPRLHQGNMLPGNKLLLRATWILLTATSNMLPNVLLLPGNMLPDVNATLYCDEGSRKTPYRYPVMYLLLYVGAYLLLKALLHARWHVTYTAGSHSFWLLCVVVLKDLTRRCTAHIWLSPINQL